MKKLFLSWLDRHYVSMSKDKYWRALQEVERYGHKKGLLTKPLLETTDIVILRKLINVMNDDKLFRLKQRQKIKILMEAIKIYYSFAMLYNKELKQIKKSYGLKKKEFFSDVIKLEGERPSCTRSGLSEGAKSGITGIIIEEQRSITALGHDWGEAELLEEATCTNNGMVRYICKRCLIQKEEIKPALGHKITSVPGQDETCTEEGKTYGTKCEVCGQWFKEPTIIKPLGHLWEQDFIAEKPTCINNGTKIYHCKRCGVQMTETLGVEYLYSDKKLFLKWLKLKYKWADSTCKSYLSAINKIEKCANVLNYGNLPYENPENIPCLYEELNNNYYFQQQTKQYRTKCDRAIKYLIEYIDAIKKLVSGELVFFHQNEQGEAVDRQPENIWHEWDNGVSHIDDSNGVSFLYTCIKCGTQHFE